MSPVAFLSRSFSRTTTGAALLGLLLPGIGRAQEPVSTAATVPQAYVELRGGYTSGRFEHYTADYKPSINLFGGNNHQAGQLVSHRFDGLLIGVGYGRQMQPKEAPTSVTLQAGFDMLAANDQLSYADGQHQRLRLLAAHPSLGLELRGRWLFQGTAGLLLGRVGYYGADQGDFLSTNIVVDTVTVVPTLHVRTGWANWLLVDGGYGTAGLLGLANPVWQSGIGTGFGSRSPVTLLAGFTGAESTTYRDATPEHFYLQLEFARAATPWRASSFMTFGSGSYRRLAVQAAYRLGTKTSH